jgi:hypothetical protein
VESRETVQEKRLGDLLAEARRRANRLERERAAAVERVRLLEEEKKATGGQKKRRARRGDDDDEVLLPDDDDNEYARSRLRMHDADQGAMLAGHGLRLASPMPHGRWRCGCGNRGGDRAFVLECADPYRESLCRWIECKCGRFRCDKKAERAALEAHFNEVCGFFDEATGLSRRRLAAMRPPSK